MEIREKQYFEKISNGRGQLKPKKKPNKKRQNREGEKEETTGFFHFN